jgi:ubiquinol-cytochrome c reductase cytochrome b subunit
LQILRKIWNAFDDRAGISRILRPIAGHLVPPHTGWMYVFGSATLVAFIIQVVTGIVLATAYIPATGDAYQSLQFISHDALLGNLLRGIHYFAASAMVLLIGIHAIRVFLMAAYKFPREVNWLTGAVLLLLTLGMGFTGQLLRWDQNAIWSVIVGAEQAGRAPVIGPTLAHFILAGDTVGGATLSRFFAFHVFFLPALIFAFLGFHLYLVLQNGISELPKAGRPVDRRTYREWYHAYLQREGRPFWPDAAWRDVVFGVAVIVTIVVLAWIFGPPELGKPPDPTIIEAYPRPDWYFLWYFALLALIPPHLETTVILFAPLVFGLALILLPFVGSQGERSPLRRPWAMAIVLFIVIIIGTLWRAGHEAPWSPNFTAQALSPQLIGTTQGPVYQGAQLFYAKGCEACHTIENHGGQRGPDLTTVGDRLTAEQMTIRILNGGTNMPPFAGNLAPDDLNALVAFLRSRHASEPSLQHAQNVGTESTRVQMEKAVN